MSATKQNFNSKLQINVKKKNKLLVTRIAKEDDTIMVLFQMIK